MVINKRIQELAISYSDVCEFCKKYNNINYIEFDYYTVNRINLFTTIENFDFDAVDDVIEKMMVAIPAIKRIFAKPIIHLKDFNEILPVESVRVVNNETIIHAAFHSELWENITEDNNIKPRKLLTRNNQDDYQIYENQVFAHTVNIMLAFLRDKLRIYKQFMYNNRNLNYDLLERLNHIKYYLALGKLHAGYIRNLERYYVIVDRAINRMQFMYNVVKSRLKRPIYRKNRLAALNNKIVIRKTNILKMHKDYHKVYNLITFLNDKNISGFYGSLNEEEKDKDILDSMLDGYSYYLEIITIFAMGHFNFQMDEKKKINFNKLNVSFDFVDWKLHILTEECDGIKFVSLNMKKDKEYKVIIIPQTRQVDKVDVASIIKEKVAADEYIVCSPFDDDLDRLYISITDIESFRRIQQIVLRMMILTDDVHKVCPFCGDTMEQDGNKYSCVSCKTVIGRAICPTHNKEYYYTEIKDYRHFVDMKKQLSDEKSWIMNHDVEAQMHYRNITKIDSDMNIICPICSQSHLD